MVADAASASGLEQSTHAHNFRITPIVIASNTTALDHRTVRQCTDERSQHLRHTGSCGQCLVKTMEQQPLLHHAMLRGIFDA